MRDQLLNAGQTNLSPQFLNVLMSWRVKNPGGLVVSQGSVLNQALALAIGPKLLQKRKRTNLLRKTLMTRYLHRNVDNLHWLQLQTSVCEGFNA